MRFRIVNILVLTCFLTISPKVIGQVTIGSSETPNLGALLDLKEKSNVNGETANRGLGMPRVELEKKNQ